MPIQQRHPQKKKQQHQMIIIITMIVVAVSVCVCVYSMFSAKIWTNSHLMSCYYTLLCNSYHITSHHSSNQQTVPAICCMYVYVQCVSVSQHVDRCQQFTPLSSTLADRFYYCCYYYSDYYYNTVCFPVFIHIVFEISSTPLPPTQPHMCCCLLAAVFSELRASVRAYFVP